MYFYVAGLFVLWKRFVVVRGVEPSVSVNGGVRTVQCGGGVARSRMITGLGLVNVSVAGDACTGLRAGQVGVGMSRLITLTGVFRASVGTFFSNLL